MRARISGLGQWLPEHVRANDEWPVEFAQRAKAHADRTLVDIPPANDDLDRITHAFLAEEAQDPFMGAKERRVAGDEPTWWGEAEAARQALDEADVDPSELDAVFSWAFCPQRVGAVTAVKVAHDIGASRAWAANLNSACASPLLQLETASALIESGRARHVLLTQSSFVTRVLPMAHPASPGVGDCAVAAVVSASERPGLLRMHAQSHGEYFDSVAYLRHHDDDPNSPWWEPGGEYSLGSLDRAGTKYLMQNTVRFGVQTVREVCEAARVEPADIDAFASVQPRGWIPIAIARGLGLDPTRVGVTYDRLAHVGGCGIFANLLACREEGLLEEGALVALYAQGAGFTRSAALVRW